MIKQGKKPSEPEWVNKPPISNEAAKEIESFRAELKVIDIRRQRDELMKVCKTVLNNIRYVNRALPKEHKGLVIDRSIHLLEDVLAEHKKEPELRSPVEDTELRGAQSDSEVPDRGK